MITHIDQSNPSDGPGVRRVRFVVSYHGAPFHGFAANRDVRTVMGELTKHIALITRNPVELTGAGRTDAGVHAWGQVVSGDLPAATDLDDLARRVNKLCESTISVRSIEWADDEFDARFDATWRRYRYHVWNDPAPNPLLAASSWHVARPLDLDAMSASASHVLGEHDFASFCRKPKVAETAQQPSLVRRVYDATWTRIDDSSMLCFEIRGSAFCHQMVRSLVGTTVDVGLGKFAPESIGDMLAARDRAVTGTVAPPHGLIMWDVGYDGDRWDADRRA